MDIGTQLQNLLDEKNITQKVLAGELGISATTLNGYMKNRRRPDPETAVRIAHYFHTTTDYLYGATSVKGIQTQPYSDMELFLLNLYRKLPDNLKTCYIAIGKTLLQNAGQKRLQLLISFYSSITQWATAYSKSLLINSFLLRPVLLEIASICTTSSSLTLMEKTLCPSSPLCFFDVITKFLLSMLHLLTIIYYAQLLIIYMLKNMLYLCP